MYILFQLSICLKIYSRLFTRCQVLFYPVKMVVNVRSASEVPIKPNTTYIISLDKILILNITDTLFIPRDSKVVSWFASLIQNVGEQNVIILTNRHPNTRDESLEQLHQNGINPSKLVCYLYKGEWIRSHRRKFNYRRIFVIEDSNDRIYNIMNHNPDVTCYYVNNEIVHQYTVIIPKITDIIAIKEYTYVLDMRALFIGDRKWYHPFFIKRLPNDVREWLSKLRSQVNVVFLINNIDMIPRLGIDGDVETTLPDTDKVVYISSNPIHTYNFGLAKPNSNIVYVHNYCK